jgi:uncharacterized RDD family membrane protein YckC
MALVQPPPPELTENRQGHYAGAASRLVAFGVDIGVIWGLFSLGAYAVSLAVQLIVGHSITLSKHQIATLIVLVAWGFIYFAYQWALGGKTIGMALLGLQVVQSDGSPIDGREAVIRTLALPLSFIVFCLGLLGILTNRERRAWHDRIAGTAVVYAWDARAARLRWLAQRGPTDNQHPPTPSR